MTVYINDQLFVDAVREILAGEPCRGLPSEPSQLLPYIFIGSQRNAESLRLLRRLKITHVLNCAGYRGPRRPDDPGRGKSPYEGLGIDYLEFKAEDQDSYDITRHFVDAFRFLDAAKRQGGVALVHCALGVNRSAATCVAYLMAEHNMPLLQAIRLIKERRRVVLTNKGFQRQLVRFARSRQMLDKDLPETTNTPKQQTQSMTVDGLPPRSDALTRYLQSRRRDRYCDSSPSSLPSHNSSLPTYSSSVPTHSNYTQTYSNSNGVHHAILPTPPQAILGMRRRSLYEGSPDAPSAFLLGVRRNSLYENSLMAPPIRYSSGYGCSAMPQYTPTADQTLTRRRYRAYSHSAGQSYGNYNNLYN